MDVCKLKKWRFLVYALLVFVFIGTIYFGVVNYNSTKSFVLQSVERETDELLNTFIADVDRFSMERTSDIELMAEHIPYVMEKDEDVTLFLTLQTLSTPTFVGLSFITPDGMIQAHDGNHFEVQQRAYFESALEGDVVFSDVFRLNQDTSQKVTAIFVPVINHDEETVGVLSGVVNLSDIVSELVENSNLPGTVFLLKDEDVLFSSNDKISFEESIPLSDQFLEKIDTRKTGSWTDSEDDLRFIKYETTWNDWVVVVDSISNKATEEITWTFWISTALVVGVTIIIAIIFYYLIRVQRRDKMQFEKDLLTGLSNRAQLELDITKKMRQNLRTSITIYFIKLDRFSSVTELHGYDVSDQLLFAISNRLKTVQNKLNVYRAGNEEFVLTISFELLEEQLDIATDLVQKIAKPIYVGQGEKIELTASIGVRTAFVKEDTNMIMQDVLFACNEAKKRGGNQFVYFTDELANENEQQRQLTNNLANALENKEFYLVYQPIHSIAEDRIVSFEALMRWKSPVLGEVGPVQFIPLLEESDKIFDAGRWLIKEVAEQVVRWKETGHKDFAVALNVSPKQLKDESFLEDLRKILTETEVDPSNLVFEVTESIVVQDVDVAFHILASLNELGIKTAIDDFGTGYSSLSLLKNLPFQYMKLDRAFVMEVLSDGGKSEAILNGLIEMANSLKLTTITEGVETLDQLEVLQKLGAHHIQGYYFSKPVLPEKAITFLEG